jgi:hypothetical protein
MLTGQSRTLSKRLIMIFLLGCDLTTSAAYPATIDLEQLLYKHTKITLDQVLSLSIRHIALTLTQLNHLDI